MKNFIAEVRNSRGKLISMQEELENIFKNGSKAIHRFTIIDKKVGVARISAIVDTLTHQQQISLVSWIHSNPTLKSGAIELKIIKMQDDNQ